MPEPESLILKILREMRAEMATKSDVERLDSKIEDVRSEVHSLRADVASDMLSLEKRLGDQISTLRRAVMAEHSSPSGPGGRCS
jgi:outer membrane protein TolC